MNICVLNSVELKWLQMSFSEVLMAQIFWSDRGGNQFSGHWIPRTCIAHTAYGRLRAQNKQTLRL